ncbi:hypothetical protein LTR37_002692 [Vermiconidia calcicola]|uniref:Uncharacterized protein n=1 Tax=Vermiconidia calcicola TaxID=1690605 RepID=A0ACC3NSE9_9PEZI|nr:hypothetical protein LTR37_002692 [Vermiconidia calcicola]
MGTLTANQNRLPEYCEHKLPTSCRLSSIPNCCACADERAHAATYSTYIDGIGFVPRGNRWQRYCWFCKEFWEHRVGVSGLRPGQTRIPEIPDQREFLDKWYEFHQGYRIVRKEDGSEERVSVLGEEFKEVSPGYLPRTLEEMRAGRQREEEVRELQEQMAQDEQPSGPSLEDTLEQMFEDASAEEAGPAAGSVNQAVRHQRLAQPEQIRHNNIHAQAMTSAASRNHEYQMRRVAALRRELTRMRNGIERVISGLRSLGEEVPNYIETTDRLTALGTTLDTISGAPSRGQDEQGTTNVNAPASSVEPSSQSDRAMNDVQARVDEARARVDEARRVRDQTASEFDLAESELRSSQHQLQQVQREQRTAENYIRVFGTREEMAAQGENYESPIGNMFSRASERFRAAEEVRREQRTLRQVLEDEARAGRDEELSEMIESQARQRDVWGVPQPQQRDAPVLESAAARRDEDLEVAELADHVPLLEDEDEMPPVLRSTGDETMLQEYYATLRRQERIEIVAGEDGYWPAQDDFPTSMLAGVRARRDRGVMELNELVEHIEEPQGTESLQANIDAEISANNEAPQPIFSVAAWWHQDAEHIIRFLTNDEPRSGLRMQSQTATALLSDLANDVVSETDRAYIDSLLRNPRIVWQMGLPTQWLRRRREQVGEDASAASLFFDRMESSPGMSIWAEDHNEYLGTELVAHAFQMSSEVRRRAALLGPREGLQTLYRLQAGQRNMADVDVLKALRDDRDAFALARTVYERHMSGREDSENSDELRRRIVEERRRVMARNGNHSRNELDARRRDASQSFALAAGRQAMQTGSRGVIAQMADRDEGTRAAYRRLQANNYLGPPPRTTLYRQLTLSDYLYDASTDSESEDAEEDEARGLDARDSGRPEPKTDDDLKVQMECKICYTQLAEVACLPCGHLVMCKWCSDQHSPCLQHDHTRPRRAAACPVCRKGIRQKVKVFRA